ncbi:MAG: alpha/beta fold hydrolase [Chloroflexi bacterium]|nr:alpha/beta fold hydrolase [Chloroflexota bacterium]
MQSLTTDTRQTRGTMMVRWPKRLLLVIPLVGTVMLVLILSTTVWRAVTLVRPPRLAVDEPEITRELPAAEQVTFQGVDGVQLVGNFVAPRNGAAVVLVHGLYANREELLPEARLLAEHGYGVLIYDNRAHGDSGGSVATWGMLESGDAARAIDYVQQRTGVAAGKIGLLGLSIGGTAALRETTTDPRVGALVVEATYSSMANEIEFMYSKYGPLSELPARWVAQLLGGLDYSQIEPKDIVCGLRSRPLLLVYGSRDPDVPATEAERMAAAACRPDALLVVNSDSHGRYMESADSSAYSERLVDFFDSHLQDVTVAHG